jgi:hypothetical protein
MHFYFLSHGLTSISHPPWTPPSHRLDYSTLASLMRPWCKLSESSHSISLFQCDLEQD